jgi:hypothetical protein
MLGRACALAATVSSIVVACGGPGFEGDDAAGGSRAVAGADSAAGQGDGGSGLGGTSGTSGTAGAAGSVSPGAAGAGEAGAPSGGAPAQPPGIVIEQASRTSVVGNVDPSITLSTAPRAGNALIVGVSCFSEVDNCLIPDGGVSDNQGNSYELVIEGGSIVSSETHGTRPYLFMAENIGEPSGDFVISVDANGAPADNYQNFAWGVLEVSGLAPDPVDRTGAFPNSCCEPSTTVATDAATRQPNELAVAVHSARSNDNDFNYLPEAGWQQQHVNDDGLSQASQHSLVSRILTEPGVVSHTWTHDEPTRGVVAVIATFRGASP